MIIDVNYWTKVARKILVALATIFLVYLSLKLAVFYMPFLIAFAISLILEPAIKFLMKRFNFKRKFSSIIVIAAIMLIIIGILVWGISSLISEGSNLLNNLNEYLETAMDRIKYLISTINLKKFNIPDSVITSIEGSSRDLLNTVVNWLQGFVKTVLNFITSIPKMGIYLVITFLSLYFICTDKVYMLDQIEHHLPELWVKKLYKHIKDLAKVLGGYLKAQVTLIVVSFVITLIGLYLLYFFGFNVKYPLLYAIGIGFVDALPIFGSGTIMLPWAIISAFYGDIKLGISLLVLWIIIIVVRQLIEPRIVGTHIGIHPIFTLIAMYTGFKLCGVIGLFVGPIVLIILKNVFGTILDKGVVKTIFSREV